MRFLFLSVVLVFTVLAFASCDGKKDSAGGKTPDSSGNSTSDNKKTTGGNMGSIYDNMADADWEAPVESGMAKIRLVLKVNGQPLKGSSSMVGEFKFTASKLRLQEGMGEGEEEQFESEGNSYQQNFNPSSKGRYVHSDLEYGYYNIEVKDTKGRYKTWSKEKVKLDEGKTLTFDVELKGN